MCGIAGAYSLEGELPPHVLNAVSAMRQPLTHRGPDASGTWVSADRRATLAATRLAVRDIRHVADQPFCSSGGATAYNGELYDWPNEAVPRDGAITSGDTEVIHQITCKNPLLLKRVSGMYAVATWRASNGSMVLARDPAGEKPLYVTRTRSWIAFASELKALVMVGLLAPDVNRDAVAMLLRLGHIPDWLSIYKGAQPLEAGTILEISSDGHETAHTWWPEPTRDSALLQPESIRAEIISAVRKASVADVPTGIFLSGGVDSSVIAAAARAGDCNLAGLTLTTPYGSIDESAAAASTARHLAMDHEVVTVTPDEARGLLVSFFESMDQPTVDGFNSYLISRAARSAGLTVALSGLGGDELFRGYPSFARMGLARWLRRMPGRRVVSPWRQALEHRKERTSDLVLATNSVESYVALRGVLGSARVERLLGGSIDWNPLLDNLRIPQPSETGDRETSSLEIREYMRAQLLRDLDVFSMASSLEVRAPLLAPSLISIARALPNDRSLRGKGLLKEAFKSDLPPELLEHPKRGFSLPWDHWMRTSLRPSILSAIRESARGDSIIDPTETREVLTAFERGHLHWSGLWVVVVLCTWRIARRSRLANADLGNPVLN